jgi:syntaxin-binding protein 1
MEAIYILAPLPHIVDCIMADFERRRYRRSWLLWTSSKSHIVRQLSSTETDIWTVLPPALRQRLDRSQMAQSQIADLKVVNIEFYPRESHIVTFRDPWSFPALYHPACNNLVPRHMADIAQKV